MSELRAEAINLIENIPERYLAEIVSYVKNFVEPEKKSSFGILSKYADKNLISQEKSAWEREVVKKYEKAEKD